MASPRHPLAFFVPLLLTAAPALAQVEEPPPPPPPETTQAEDPVPARGNREGPRGNRQGRPDRPGRGQRQAPIVIEAGHIHPVSGPTIKGGVVLIRGERIVAVGNKGEVEIPANATTRAFPDGHVYPGLIDASTNAFTDPALASTTLDHGLAIADDLQLRHTRDDELAAAGITTIYTAARGGQGAIVRPQRTGYAVWAGKENAALQLQMTSGPVPSHPLQRQQQLDGLLRTFDSLEQYEKAKADFDKAIEKYEKDFAEYLAFHKKNEGKAKPAETGKPEEAEPTERPGGRPTRGPGGRRGGPPGGNHAEGSEQVDRALEQLLLALAEVPKQDPVKQGPEPTPPAGQNPPAEAGKPAAEKAPSAPKRPTYPKKPAEDPAKEALLRVLAGELPLRVEAHRPEELRAALRFLREKDVPILVLEKAYGAAALASDLAATGALVVLTDVLPNSMPKLYESFDPQALPAKLQQAGVAFAIATGSARRASLLPSMAAAAVGKGLAADAALRAITLTPAEILGVQKDTGSLQAGKYGDLVVFDRPLFQSDSHVLLVLGRGRTEYEAK